MDFPVGEAFQNGELWQVTTPNNPTGFAKGAWAQLIAATPYDVIGLHLWSYNYIPGWTRGFYHDIGVGASGSETVLIPDVTVISNQSSLDWMPLYLGYFPIAIPKGTRVSARSATNTGTFDSNVWAQPVYACGFGGGGAGHPILSGWEHLGGANVTGLTGGFGSWTVINASVSRTYKWLNVLYYNNSGVTYGFRGQVGIGASSAEEVIATETRLFRTNAYNVETDAPGFSIPCHIPKGSRITARFGYTGAGADRDILFYLSGGY